MDEMLDILDEDGNKTGVVKSRKEAHREGDWHRVAFIFVVNDKGEIILQKRSAQKSSNPNKWTASASGHLAAGDSKIEGALRELEEEIGVKASAEELKYLFTVKEHDLNPQIDRNANHIGDVYVLYRNIDSKDLVLQEEEVSEVKYVYYKDFEQMILRDKDIFVRHDEIYARLLEELYEKFNN